MTVYTPKLVQMGRKTAKRVQEATAEGRCLGHECKNKAETRGLCNGCYQAARRLIRSGDVSEDQLVASGHMLDKKESQLGRPPSNPITKTVKEIA